MEERHEIVELLRDNSKDSLEEIVTTLDINPRSYNKSQLAVIIFLFNVSTFPHTPDQIYLELLDGLEQRIHVKDMFIVQSTLWTRDVISALSDTKRRNLARILGLADNTRDVRIILNAIDAIKVARTRTLPTKLKLFKSPAVHASSSPYRLSENIPGLSDEETRQYLAMLALEQEYRASSSSSSSSSAAAATAAPVEFSEWDLDESEELARRLQAEEEEWLRQEYAHSPARPDVAATAAGGSRVSPRMSARSDVAATAAGGSSERYRLNGPELAELERQSNPDPKAFVPRTHFTFRELSDALTIKQGIDTSTSMGIHNAFDNFKDLPKALTILKQSSGRKNEIKQDQLPELKKIVIEFAARMDDRPYLSKIDTTVEAYIQKKIDDLIAKVCKYKSKSARMSIKRGGKVYTVDGKAKTVGINDLLHDVMHILRTMHPYFQTRWAAAFIESNESAYGDESMSCADGIVERPICIFAQELKLVAGEGSKEELKAEEVLRKKNLVKQWMYAFFQKIADDEEKGGDGKFINARDEPLLMAFIREKVEQDQRPVWGEWEPVIETFIKSTSFKELVVLYQGKRRRSKKRRVNKRRSKKCRA